MTLPTLVIDFKSYFELFNVEADHLPAKTIMIQGTCSDAGKSLITAALCRIFKEDGINVAPFKSQNMSLNSYVTLDGREIARAQVVQAQAAGLEPDTRMSPILLKPGSEIKSQVIINGKPVGNMSWQEYMKYKPQAFAAVKESFDSLAADYDLIVIEGAGSPAEINLNHDDIVNMGMARYAKAPVLLVGDIDRGGVFASFIGTYELLNDWERELLAGFIINKFRGDPSLLKEALDVTEQRTGKKMIGTVPWIYDLGLPEEDAVRQKSKKGGADLLDIVIVGLNHISNYTDFDAFELEEDAQLRLVRNPQDFGNPDCVIIPGSKTTVSDFRYLQQSGMTEKVKDFAVNGGLTVGICGGFQMLGNEVHDPQQIESASCETLGLLNMSTTMLQDKNLRRVSANFKGFGIVDGYEIHHGKTDNTDCEVIVEKEGEILGLRNNNIWGTYLHGIFDNDLFRHDFLNELRNKKGLEQKTEIKKYDLEPSFKKLADTVRSSIDISFLYNILEI